MSSISWIISNAQKDNNKQTKTTKLEGKWTIQEENNNARTTSLKSLADNNPIKNKIVLTKWQTNTKPPKKDNHPNKSRNKKPK